MTRHPIAALEVADADAMVALGARLAGFLRPGDSVCLTGPLGAGKTTLTRGLAAGLEVAGDIASPTFVIARRHRGPAGDLLHCDAYRVGGAEEFADLDLDTDGAVVVVEWGQYVMAEISDSWLEIQIDRSSGAADERRLVALIGHGPRWEGEAVRRMVAAVGESR